MRRNDPCPCNSGRKYKKCCGALADASPVTAPFIQGEAFNSAEALIRAREYARQGRMEEALAAYQDILTADPACVEAWNDIGNIHFMHQEVARSLAAYDKAARLRPGYAQAHFNRGLALQTLGRLAEAVLAYEEVLRLEPANIQALVEMGRALVATGHCDEAIRASRKALEIQPSALPAYNNWGCALFVRKEYAEAEKVLLRGLEQDESQVELCITLAKLYERLNRLDASFESVEKALFRDPANPAANLIMAALLRRKGQPEEGLVRLNGVSQPVLDQDLAAAIQFELGRLYDLVGESASAMVHFDRANTFWREQATSDRKEYLKIVSSLRRAAEQLSESESENAVFPTANQGPQPIFLVGFPRSGTTLLHQILATHPDLEVLDEKPLIEEVRKQARHCSGSDPAELETIPERELARLRNFYWQEASRHGATGAKRMVDKQPLNIVHIGLITRLFPEAKIIVNLRHPCDVCLSCFMQDFVDNPAMANFTTLADTVRLYGEVMALYLHSEKAHMTHLHRFCYEGLIEEYQAEMRSLITFLGIAWSDAFYQFHEQSTAGGVISTASYGQVAEPLYDRARYRWLRYREYLEPFLPQLMPFIKALGYKER